MADSRWSIPLESLVEKTKLQLDTVARKATLDLFSAVVLRSPVGNPDLWEANQEAAFNREAARAFAEVDGKRAPSAKKLRKDFPNVAGKGYVGGRFRANWNVSYGTPDDSVTESTVKGRADAEAAKALTLPVGGVVFMTNGLPYAKRLEYEGWSSQAPAGMVRISALQFGDYVREALKS